MAKQLDRDQVEVRLQFTADVNKAKQQLQDLQKTLQRITTTTNTSSQLGLTKQLNEAVVAAAKLQVNLQAATNQQTGKLDLSRFNQQMKDSGMSLQKYREQLSALGPDGERAFVQLAQSITTAEIPLKRTNVTLEKFKNTLINTARWQISSSILHGFMGAIQSAYGYAKDLNASLNNIRIVTGQSTEQMAAFAEQANKAAQRLSTTTTAYTDAALIYYQQGIRDQGEIQERTDTTIKLANVSRQSAEEVSSQMTAIWNNFDDGTKSLEFYADAITALGASTASSSSEIATGMSKFAAIAKTVGLSYEYAAAGLATVVAQTRQSADTVGTSFRTLFSRLEGLKLGETLEDGVDLNKYSKALQTIGVQLMDVNGNIRQMDDILNDTAAHWDNLTQAQKVAFAETVGGVRQYTNLIALMDNWDKMQENILTAKNSEGTLQKQADIYGESWEAARRRVKAAAEDIYKTLLNDDFFIGLNNGFATILKSVNQFIDSIGGLKGVLLTVGAILTTVFQKNIANGISNMVYSLKMLTQSGRESIKKTQTEANNELVTMYKQKTGVGASATAEAYEDLGRLQNSYIDNALKMTEAERSTNQILIERANLQAKEIANQGEVLSNQEKEVSVAKRLLNYQIQRVQFSQDSTKTGVQNRKIAADLQAEMKNYEILMQNYAKLRSSPEALQKATQFDEKAVALGMADISKMSFSSKNIPILTNQLRELSEEAKKAGNDTTELDKKIEHFSQMTGKGKAGSAARSVFKTIQDEIISMGNSVAVAETKVELSKNNLISMAEQLGAKYPFLTTQVQRYIEAIEQENITKEELLQKTKQFRQEVDGMIGQYEGNAQRQIKANEAVASSFSMIMSSAMILTQVTGLIKTLNDESVPAGQKIIQLLMTIGMTAPMIIKLIPEFATLNHTIMNGEKAVTLFGTSVELTKLKLLGIIAIIIAAVAALVALGKYLHSISPEGRLARAKESAEQLSGALDDAKSAAEELNQAFNSYDNAVNKLNECTKGTQEWYNALRDVNNEVLDLIAKYPQLSTEEENYITQTSDGLMQLTDEGRQFLEAESQQRVINAQAASIAANQDVRNKEIEVKVSNLKDFLMFDNAGNAMDKSVEEYIMNSLEDFQDLSVEAIKSRLQDRFDYLALDMDSLANDIADLASAVRDNTAQTEIENKALVGSQLSNTGILDNKKYKDFEADIINATSESYQKEYEKAMQKAINEGWGTEGIAQIDGINAEARKIWAEYLEAAKLSPKDYQLLDTTGTDANRAFKYTDSSGEDKTITLEAMREVKASAEALNSLGEVAQKVGDNLYTLYTSSNDYDKALGKFLANGNFESVTKGQLTDLSNQANGDSEAVANYLIKTLGYEDILSMAQAYGYDSAEEFMEAYSQAMEDSMTALETLQNVSSLTSDWSEDLTLESSKRLEEVFDKINIGPKGTQVGKDFVKALDEVLGEIDPEDVQQALSQIINIDWSQEDAFIQFQDILSSFGAEVDFGAESWEEFAKNMALAADAQPDFSKLRDQLAEISGLLNGLDFGKTIKAEDYESIIAAGQDIGEDWKDLFQYQTDGTYKFLGNVEQMKKATLEQFKQHRKELQTTQDLQEKFLNENQTLNGENFDWYDSEAEFDKMKGLQNLMSRQSGKDVLSHIGYEQKDINSIQEDASEAQRLLANAGGDIANLPEEEQQFYNNAIGRLEEVYNRIFEFVNIDTAHEDELDQQAIASTANTMGEAYQMSETGQIDYSVAAQQIKYLAECGMQAATTFDELKSVMVEASQYDDVILDSEIFSQKLIELAEKYDNCTQEINKYKDALKSGDEEQITAAEGSLQAAMLAGENAQTYGFDPEIMEDMTRAFADRNKELAEGEGMLEADAEAAADAATRYMRLQEAVDDLYDNYDDYKDLLGEISNETSEIAKMERLASKEGVALRKSLAGLLDTSEELVDVNLVDAIDPADFEKAAMGDEEAIGRIRDAFIDAQAEAYNLSDMPELNDFKARMNELADGAVIDIDNEPFLQKLIASMVAAGATAPEIEAALSGFGIDCDITPFENAMAAAADSATQAGDAIIDATSFDTEDISQTSQDQDTKENVTYTESIDATPVTKVSRVLEENGKNLKDLYEVRQQWYTRVTPVKTDQTETKETTTHAVRVSNAHKSGGGHVGSSHKNTSTGGGGKGGGGCFVAGTPITMKGYYKNIEEIKKGDIVLSYNELTKQNEYSKVLQTMIHLVYENIYSLYIENEVLEVTGIHRFLITRNNKTAWIAAADLQIGDLVLFANGTLHRIYDITTDLRAEVVYNFEVSNNHNYYVGKNQILAHNKGGGGGGGKQKEVKKSADDKSERYHVVNAKLTDQNRRLEEAGKRKDEQEGKAKHEAALQEIKDLQTTIDLNKEKLEEAKNWLAYDKQALQQFGDLVLNKDGEILNYDQLWQDNLAKYNQAIMRYNASAQEDADKKALEAAEEQWKLFQDNLKQYEETLQLTMDLEVEINDQELQKYLLKTEDNIHQVEYRLEFDDRSKSYFDYLISKSKEFNSTLNQNAEILKYLGQESKTLINEVATINTGIDNTLRHYLTDKYRDKYGNQLAVDEIEKLIQRVENNETTIEDREILSTMPAEELSQIFDWQEQLVDKNQEIMDNIQAVAENVGDFWENTLDKMERVAKPIERAIEGIQHYKEVVDIVGKDLLGITKELEQQMEGQEIQAQNMEVRNARRELQSLKEAYDRTAEEYQHALEIGATSTAEALKGEMERIEDMIDDATSTFYDKWEEALRSITDAFQKNIDDIKDDALDKLASPIFNFTWQTLQDALDYSKEAADNYVPVYKEIYELSKLNRDINKSINDTDNLKNKEALRDLQKEINKLEEDSGKISQYDLDNARKQYELTLARLQLEEAQNVKDIVRLSKNAQGDWSYIYTANQENVEAAEQNYEDKLFAMQQANAEYINDLQDELVDLEDKYYDKMADINNDLELSAEQKEQALQELEAWHADQLAYYSDEMNKVLDNNNKLYNEDWKWYSDFTAQKMAANEAYTEHNKAQNGYRLADEEEYVDNFNETLLGQKLGYDTVNEYAKNSADVAAQAVQEMTEEYQIWKERTESTMQAAGTSINSFAADASEDMDQMIDKAEEAQVAFSDFADEADEEFKTLIERTDEWITKYAKGLDEIIGKNETLIESIQKLNNLISAPDANDNGTEKGRAARTDTQGEKLTGPALALAVAKDMWTWDDDGSNRTGWAWSTGTGGLIDKKLGAGMGQMVQSYLNKIAAGQITVEPEEQEGLKQYHMKYFDTGGYTGDWNGNGGRLAVLHQKEIVLNQMDTDNLLTAVNIVRDIAHMIDLNAKATEVSTGNISAIGVQSGAATQIEQSVHITADFPSVSDRNEIEAAFEMLINEASQYAYRK